MQLHVEGLLVWYTQTWVQFPIPQNKFCLCGFPKLLYILKTCIQGLHIDSHTQTHLRQTLLQSRLSQTKHTGSDDKYLTLLPLPECWYQKVCHHTQFMVVGGMNQSFVQWQASVHYLSYTSSSEMFISKIIFYFSLVQSLLQLNYLNFPSAKFLCFLLAIHKYSRFTLISVYFLKVKNFGAGEMAQ